MFILSYICGMNLCAENTFVSSGDSSCYKYVHLLLGDLLHTDFAGYFHLFIIYWNLIFLSKCSTSTVPVCLFVCTHTVLILLSQGQCEHTHLNTHPHNVVYNRWYICQQIKPCWKINQFTSSPRLIDFSIMAILQFSLLWALRLRFPPFSTNPSITILVK